MVTTPDNISASTLNNSPLSSVTYLTSLSASAKFQLASKCQPSFLSPNLDSPNTYARIVFIGYSSAFNIIIPDKLFSKLRQLSINSQMCQWILNVLLDRPQVVMVNTLLSQPLILSTGAPQGVCSLHFSTPISQMTAALTATVHLYSSFQMTLR